MAKIKETVEKAFGQVPKEVCWNGFFDYKQSTTSKIYSWFLKYFKKIL